jgi:outer membrane protein assembly factor BamD (BamD/ComL family)
LQEEDELYLESIVAIREKNYQEAEDKLKILLERYGADKNRKAEVILGCLLIRRECQRLESSFEN